MLDAPRSRTSAERRAMASDKISEGKPRAAMEAMVSASMAERRVYVRTLKWVLEDLDDWHQDRLRRWLDKIDDAGRDEPPPVIGKG